MTGRLVDTHYHLSKDPDPGRRVRECESAQIQVIAVTEAPSEFEAVRALTAQCERVEAALGLHPSSIENDSSEQELFWSLLSSTRYVGEIGLDYCTEDQNERRLRREIFERILRECADAGDKVLSVHSRRAAGDVIAMVGEGFAGVVILHWFSGSPTELEMATRSNMYFSVNPAMVKSNRGRQLVAHMNPDFVLTETDGPYVQVNGKPALPGDVAIVIEDLANLWRQSHEEVRERVGTNFLRAIGAGRRLD